MGKRLVLTMAVVTLMFSLSAKAATLTVTNNADLGPGSLREAISIADSNGENDIIVFDAHYTITLASTLPQVTSVITINGYGWSHTILDGGNPKGGSSGVRILDVGSGGHLILDGVMVQNGYDAINGGAIVVGNDATFLFRNSRCENNRAGYGGCIFTANTAPDITVEDSELAGNVAFSGFGGAISYANYSAVSGNLTVRRSTLSQNTAETSGAGIFATGSRSLQMEDSLVVYNNATNGANNANFGGIYADNATLTNSTLSTNTSQVTGGGIAIGVSGSLTNVTVTGNWGGGITGGALVTLVNTIVEGNFGGNCTAPVTSGGNNLENTDTCGFGVIDFVGVDPMLGLLRNNGGRTQTHALTPGSPAIDAGNDAFAPATDQRGVPRPYDGDGDSIPRSDIGAYEWAPVVFADGFESGSLGGWSSSLP